MTETEVVAKLRPPCPIFSAEAPPANYVRFRISGDPVIAIGASIKTAGDQLRGCPIELIADQECGEDDMLPYEELLGDAMAGNQTWFAREDYVEEAWRIVDPILDNPNVSPYQPGTWGPAEADKLIASLGAGGIPNSRSQASASCSRKSEPTRWEGRLLRVCQSPDSATRPFSIT